MDFALGRCAPFAPPLFGNPGSAPALKHNEHDNLSKALYTVKFSLSFIYTKIWRQIVVFHRGWFAASSASNRRQSVHDFPDVQRTPLSERVSYDAQQVGFPWASCVGFRLLRRGRLRSRGGGIWGARICAEYLLISLPHKNLEREKSKKRKNITLGCSMLQWN